MRSVARFGFVLCCVAAGLMACTNKSKNRTRDELVVHVLAEPTFLDWGKSTDIYCAHIIENLQVGLAETEISSGVVKTIPMLAESWESAAGGSQFTFRLRKDAKWHDGVPVTAEHFVDGWRRLVDPKTASEYAYFLFNVKNAQAIAAGKMPLESMGITAVDPYTLKVTLEAPMSFFPSLLSHHSTFPVRNDLIKKFGDQWTEAGNLVGNGPYKLAAWVHDSKVVLERNDAWIGKKPAIKTVVFRIVNELTQAVNLFETGEIDLIYPEVPKLDMDRLRKQHGKDLHEANPLSIYYYEFNIRKKPLDDVRVRRAISMAIDRSELTRMNNAGELPMTSMIPKGLPEFNPDLGVKFDPVKAKQLLKEAGVDPATVQPLPLLFNSNENHQRVAENVQAQLARNLGIKIEVLTQEMKVYNATMQNQKRVKNHNSPEVPAFNRYGWVADYPDTDNFLAIFTSGSDNNHTGWSNPTYDALVKEGLSESNPEKRMEIYAKAHKMLVEDQVVIMPLFIYSMQALVQPYVKGYTPHPMNKLVLKDLLLEGK